MPANPFEFEAANKFSVQEMVNYFIPDENFTRFLDSRKNVFLVGDRGTGKTMALRYYSLEVQFHKSQQVEVTPNSQLDHIGVYVPCRGPDVGKTEPDLLDSFLGRLSGEHLLVTRMVAALSKALAGIPQLATESESQNLALELPFLLPWQLPAHGNIFSALALAAKAESRKAQQELNKRKPDSFYDNVATFGTVFQPLVETLTSTVAALKNAHFSLMFDDAEELSELQNETLNSWIAVRDTSRISFKVATSAVDQRPLRTLNGGGLLERHDFIRVDLEQDFQNSDANYGKLAHKIVTRRLLDIGINVTPDDFFPVHPQMLKGLAEAEAKARAEAEIKFSDDKKIRDYVYKMSRAYFFRDRPAKANRPPYSGFELMVHVSTGVIRYLLEPCYMMYDEALSAQEDKEQPVLSIKPSVQTNCLETLSKRRWEWINEGFNNSVPDCTWETAKKIYRLVDQLAVLFKHRLKTHASEPRAISFSISAWPRLSDDESVELQNILKIARRAQILFKRLSTGKTNGRADEYYTFDRLLWIDRGLDPVGQNARVSVEAQYLLEAARTGKPLPISSDAKRVGADSPELFNEDSYHE